MSVSAVKHFKDIKSCISSNQNLGMLRILEVYGKENRTIFKTKDINQNITWYALTWSGLVTLW